MKIGYLGPQGTYTEEATDQFIIQQGIVKSEKVSFTSIKTVFESLDKQEVKALVVPLRNSIAGDYKETSECLQKYRVSQVDYLKLKIKLAIGIHPKAVKEDVTEIKSKDTALKECAIYLKRNFSQASKVEVESTSTTMEEIIVNNLRSVAAIGSERGMRLYGLKIINEDIGDKEENVTTFIYLVKKHEGRV